LECGGIAYIILFLCLFSYNIDILGPVINNEIMSVTSDESELREFVTPSVSQFRDMTGLSIKFVGEHTWKTLTCSDMDAIIKNGEREDIHLSCEDEIGKWVKFHIPDEGEHHAHVNGVNMYHPFRYSMMIACKADKTHLCRDQSFGM